ncbi:hypothetical protein HT031_003236 [Scenedesmus sp. PABB004]|nr:hypothetical protein HT031_003236 [Scenedesmus sp. PABB004]
MWAAHNGVVRGSGLGALSDTLYRVCIPLDQAATASFMGLLLVLASGYCITRSNFGEYRLQVLGIPPLLFATGVVTQYINFQLLEASTDQLDVLEFAGWEAGLFAVCTFLNVAAFLFWVVYIFEIIQAEVDALRAQQELNLVRSAAPSATVAPFPDGAAPRAPAAPLDPWSLAPPSRGGAPADRSGLSSDPHAAPPPGVDPDWARAAAEEGVVAYKNLLGPAQNMSHVPGADAEAQEITTVVDMVNFETKRAMYRRFSTGFAVFMVAQLCVILAPVFILDVVQEVITAFQAAVVYAYLAALLWLFRPAAESPYLLMDDDVSHLDTALGVVGDDGDGDGDGGAGRGRHSAEADAEEAAAVAAAAARGRAARAAVELAAVGKHGGGGAADRERGRDQSGGGGVLPVSRSAQDLNPATPAAAGGASSAAAMAALVGDLPVRLPAIRTSVGGAPGGAAAQAAQRPAAAPAPAPAPGALAAASSHFSLDGDDELHEVTLHTSPPQKRD